MAALGQYGSLGEPCSGTRASRTGRYASGGQSGVGEARVLFLDRGGSDDRAVSIGSGVHIRPGRLAVIWVGTRSFRHVHPLADDPAIGPLVDRYGRLELETTDTPFERLVISITNQQLSTTAAETIRNRLFEAVDPAPTAILDADDETLREAGLSSQKVSTLDDVARAFRDGDLGRDSLAALSDEAVVDRLTSIRGVGPWTAKTFIMFGLGREDVFPVEDLGIRRGMEELFGELTRPEMETKAEAWRPHRSHASLYIWRVASE